jgi:hypothetical protein
MPHAVRERKKFLENRWKEMKIRLHQKKFKTTKPHIAETVSYEARNVVLVAFYENDKYNSIVKSQKPQNYASKNSELRSAERRSRGFLRDDNNQGAKGAFPFVAARLPSTGKGHPLSCLNGTRMVSLQQRGALVQGAQFIAPNRHDAAEVQ